MASKLVLFKTIPTKLRRWVPPECRGEIHLVNYDNKTLTGYGEHSCRRYYSDGMSQAARKCKGWLEIKVDTKSYVRQEVHDRSLYLKLKSKYEPETTDTIMDKLKEVISGD